jgi:uncharacterized protein YdhG (YjbR/CyaY superfamily)
MADRFASVEEYLDALPDDTRTVLEGIRRSIRTVAPGVGEKISYQMPTFTLDGRPLVHVAAWKKHAALYPLPPLQGELAAEVEPYRGAKDAMHLRYDRPIPYDLVERVVAVMVDQRTATNAAQDTGS